MNPSSGTAERDAGRELSRDLARYYDLDLAGDDPGDLVLYRTLARRTGGDVLEFGVGTGRLAVPLAVDGLRVTGVDIDSARLERAAARWRTSARDAAPGGSLELIQTDLLELDLGRQFGLAFFALNGLLELRTRDQQLGAMRTLARHLAPDGAAAVDVSLVAAEDRALYDGRPRLEWVRDDAETGTRVAKVLTASVSEAGFVELRTRFDAWSHRKGRAHRADRLDRLRLIGRDDLLSLATEAGFGRRELFGTYDGKPFEPGAERIVLVAGLV